MANKFDLKTLYPKLASGTLTEAELNWLVKYFDTGDPKVLYHLVRSELRLSDEVPPATSEETLKLQGVHDRLKKQLKKGEVQQTPIKRLWPRIAAAVILVVAVSIGIYFYLGSPTGNLPDIAPGGNKATLTLADGRTIELSETQDGIVIGDALTYLDGKEVLDTGKENLASGVSSIMSISTPKGGQYQLRLPDGTKVWLNAASSLTYPASFTSAGERRVELSGEAYFEVAKDRDHPFIVKTGKQTLEVLGTQFNIKAYLDEPVTQTTLLEGSVKLASSGNQAILKPGQQANLSDHQMQVKEVEAEYAISWKEGYFMFNSERLESIMFKIARWYNVEVEFEDPALKNETFFGSISRFEHVSKVLKMLETTDVATFHLNNNKISIRKK